MARPEKQFTFTYEDVRRLTGQSMARLYAAVSYEELDLNDLESVFYYLARFGTLDVKRNALEHMLIRTRKRK